MAQINLFSGEIEENIIAPAEIIPEIPKEAPAKKRRKGKQSFEVTRCGRCDQLIMRDPDNDRDNGLCEKCDPRLSAQFDRFRNIPLEKALRIHKLINNNKPLKYL